jgi:hypothetical protein
MVNFLDELVDEIGDRETHALMGLLDIVSLFVHDYEERDSEFPNSEPHAALRFFMEQHNLRQADLANIFGSHSNVRDVFKRQAGNRHVSSHPCCPISCFCSCIHAKFEAPIASITRSYEAHCDEEDLEYARFSEKGKRRRVPGN